MRAVLALEDHLFKFVFLQKALILCCLTLFPNDFEAFFSQFKSLDQLDSLFPQDLSTAKAVFG